MSQARLDELIPHRPPMRLVEEIVGCAGGELVCRGRIPPSLAAGGVASPLLGLELGAQAAAVLEALDGGAAGAPRTEPRIGYLVSIRDARFSREGLPAGQLLTVRVRRTGGMAPLALFTVAVESTADRTLHLEATIGTFAVP